MLENLTERQKFLAVYAVVAVLILFTISYFNEKYDLSLFITAFIASFTASIIYDKIKRHIPPI